MLYDGASFDYTFSFLGLALIEAPKFAQNAFHQILSAIRSYGLL